MKPTLDQATERLQAHWGYDRFRPGQDAAIAQVLAGRDALIVLPTGGGKSLCYQVPALLQEGVTLVVSPLIALMNDQVEALKARGISAIALHSQLSPRAIDQAFTDIEFGRYRLVYLAPERLYSELFQARAGRLKVAFLAVDEAHCISEWGYDFRPAYLRIPESYPLIGHPPVVALTATATPAVRRDIQERLALRDPFVAVQGFDRPKLVWSVFHTSDKRAKVEDVLAGVPGAGVVYASTRRGVEAWARWLATREVSVSAYHAGMEKARREAEASTWLAGRTRVMVATNAFGMGIDHPGVRFVIHVDLPATLEGYYQEAGRAGRDGNTAYAILLFDPADEATHRNMMQDSHPEHAFVTRVFEAVCNTHRIAIGSHPDVPLPVDVSVLADQLKAGAGRVRASMEYVVRAGVWEMLPPAPDAGSIRIHTTPAGFRAAAERMQANPTASALVQLLLRRIHAEAYAEGAPLDLRMVERGLSVNREQAEQALDFLQQRQLITWIRPVGGARVRFLAPRPARLSVDDRARREALMRAETRLADMVRYARSTGCRRHFLLGYFGEAAPDACGKCDVCLGRHEPPQLHAGDMEPLRRLLQTIHSGQLSIQMEPLAPRERRRIEAMLHHLESEGFVRCEDPLTFRYSLTPVGLRAANTGG